MDTIFDKPLNKELNDKPDYATEIPMSDSDSTTVSQAITNINNTIGTQSQNLSSFVIPLEVKKSANVVTVTIGYTQAKESLSKNTEKILGSIPEAYRPSSSVYTSCLLIDNTGNLVAYLRISISSSNGNLYAYPSAAISTSQYLFGSFTYCI